MAKLSTERLLLRPFRRTDASAFAALAGEWAVASMTSDIPFPLAPDQALAWLQPSSGEVRFAIEREHRLIGGAGFYWRSSGSAELGFWLGMPYWGQGYATEATRAVLLHGFQKHRVPLFTSAHFADNPMSRNVLRKLGFEPTGTCRIGCVARGRDVEAVTYWLDRQRAVNFIPGIARKPAPLDRLRDIVGRWRRAGERAKERSSGLS